MRFLSLKKYILFSRYNSELKTSSCFIFSLKAVPALSSEDHFALSKTICASETQQKAAAVF